MQSKNLDILADKRKQNGQVLMMLANYCRKHRMIDFDLRCAPSDDLGRIGNEIVDLFVDRMGEHQAQTPPCPRASGGENTAKNRGLSRSR